MSRKCFVLLNHKLEENQAIELKDCYGVDEIVLAPEDLASRWLQVPAEGEFPYEHVDPILDWIGDNYKIGDIIWVQGEPAAVMVVTERSKELGLVAVYATTKRESVDIGDGKKVMIFQHVNFRCYPGFSFQKEVEYCGWEVAEKDNGDLVLFYKEDGRVVRVEVEGSKEEIRNWILTGAKNSFDGNTFYIIHPYKEWTSVHMGCCGGYPSIEGIEKDFPLLA